MRWRRIALVAAMLVPAAALAQGFGGAAFEDADTILVIDRAARTEGLKFERIDLPDTRRTVLGEGYYFDGPEALKDDARAAPDVQAIGPERALVLGRFDGLYDVTPYGEAEIWEAGYRVGDYQSVVASDGTPYLFAHGFEPGADGTTLDFLRLLRGQTDPQFGPWQELGSVEQYFADCSPVGVDLDSAGQPIMFCNHPDYGLYEMTLSGDAIDFTSTTELHGSEFAISPHSSPLTVFFGESTTDGTFSTSIRRATRTSSGNFAIEPIATVPIGGSAFDALTPGGRDLVVFSGYRTGTTHRTYELWAMSHDASGWNTTQLADDLDQHDQVRVRAEGKVLVGSERLRLFQREPGGTWTEIDLGSIGDERCLACNPLRCDVSFGDSATAGLGALLLGLLALAAVRARA